MCDVCFEEPLSLPEDVFENSGTSSFVCLQSQSSKRRAGTEDCCGCNLGEDALFICQDRNTTGDADGICSWASKGMDAAEYAQELMRNCLLAVQKEQGEIDPKRVIKQAYTCTVAKGSSTACIMTVKPNSLHVANVGDGGFALIRNGVSIYPSPVKLHSFNQPYQLRKASKASDPSSAQKFEAPVKAGDIIVTAGANR
ncbi:hypothetical protein RJ640_018501 [Escallonia rubra]|uniref:Protein phosphatase n=1 Tax=Escallonia rubra TaxID=112253 RepID=A0AA88RPL6_9ASTE|nr:hypothetical protein RJ640_018501 [Escallonia rubra]